MTKPEQALTQRIKEIRRRHFGARGRDAFAERLGISAADYARYERGTLPPGDVMVRICEVTGEDLQWLLTGVAGRGTVVISGTRGRHQTLLANLAQLLDEHPALAAPVEAFVNLLAQGEAVRGRQRPALPVPKVEHLLPIFDPDDLPILPPGVEGGDAGGFDLACFAVADSPAQRSAVEVVEPALKYASNAGRRGEVLTMTDDVGGARCCLHSREAADYFPQAFVVRLADDAMRPMFVSGDGVLVAPGVPARVGRPVLCRVRGDQQPRYRIWLGDEDGLVSFGRLDDEGTEQVAAGELLWSLEVIFSVRQAA